MPTRAELPSARRLVRSTLLALIAAIAILVTIVLPAEYGVDPTGIGRVLGLAEMGEIKVQLAEEAEADRLRHGAQRGDPRDQSMLIDRVIGLFFSSAHAHPDQAEHGAQDHAEADSSANHSEDEVIVTLAPGDYVEVKLIMSEGAVATYAWQVDGGLINFDLHGHGTGGESESYEKGRGVSDGSGSFTAAFNGEHGWFFRNRDKQDLTLTFEVRGAYSEMKQSGSGD
jgi:hypothetical protein